MKRLCILLVFSSVALLAHPGRAEAPYQLPGGAAAYDDPFIAAGFRALFTCSAHFAMKRPLDDILEIELRDTATLELPVPVIDEKRQLVKASDGQGETRIAAFRDTMGCTLLPPHWSENEVPNLPYVALSRPAANPDAPFPLGDDASPRPDREQRHARW